MFYRSHLDKLIYPVIAAVLLDQFNAALAKRRLLAKTSSIKKEVVQSSDAGVPLKPKTT